MQADSRFQMCRHAATGGSEDTAGQREGLMMFRFALTESAPALRTRLIGLDQIGDVLPRETPKVDALERRRQIRVRQEHVARRYFP